MAFTWGIPKSLIKRVSEIEIDTHYYDKDVIPTSQNVFTYTVDETNKIAVITGLKEHGYENITVPFEIHYDTTTEKKVAKVIAISDGCFTSENNLKTVILPNTIHEIPTNCFKDNSNLTTVLIPSSINTIKENAFNNNDSLQTVFIPYSVSTIEDNAFVGNDNLKILCYKYSIAEEYAIGNGIPYSLISYTLDEEVTKDSENLVTSGAIYDAILWEKGDGLNSIKNKNVPGSASGKYSFNTGFQCYSRGDYSTSRGFQTHAGPSASAVIPNWAEGYCADASGYMTSALGDKSHTEGDNTITNNLGEHAEGRFNKSNMNSQNYGDPLNTQHSVGIGYAGQHGEFDHHKNAFEIMQNGDIYMYGVGSYDGTNPSDATTIQDSINSNKTNIETSTEVEARILQPSNNTEYRFSVEMLSLTLGLPTSPQDNYIFSVVFKSGSTATSIIYSTSIKWTGDDLTDDIFSPKEGKQYTLIIWYDGLWNGAVRGVAT